MLIGVPLASTVYTLFGEATAKREAKASACVTSEAEVETVPETPIERDESADAVDSVAEGTSACDATATVKHAPVQSATPRKNKKKRKNK
jgi:hypothetical protein